MRRPRCSRFRTEVVPERKKTRRELALSLLPYIVVYKVVGDVVFVVRILHGAQKWPWRFA
jgi:plasmid stabilization system protein ParE